MRFNVLFFLSIFILQRTFPSKNTNKKGERQNRSAVLGCFHEEIIYFTNSYVDWL